MQRITSLETSLHSLKQQAQPAHPTRPETHSRRGSHLAPYAVEQLHHHVSHLESNFSHIERRVDQADLKIVEVDEKVDLVHSSFHKGLRLQLKQTEELNQKLATMSVSTEQRLDALEQQLQEHVQERELSGATQAITTDKRGTITPVFAGDFVSTVLNSVYNNAQVYLEDTFPVLSFQNELVETKAKRPITDKIAYLIGDVMRYNTRVHEMTLHVMTTQPAVLTYLFQCLSTNHALKAFNFVSDNSLELSTHVLDALAVLLDSNSNLQHIRLRNVQLNHEACEQLAMLVEKHFTITIELRSCRIPPMLLSRLAATRVIIGK
jgi:hypothetical protein